MTMDDANSVQGRQEVVIRPVRWPDDEAKLGALDTSFTTCRIYRVDRGPLSFRLVEAAVDPPVRKSYGMLRNKGDRLRQLGHVVASEEDGTLVGVAAADLAAWSRRVQVEGIFVAPQARGRGVGRALMASVTDFAREVGAGCVWVETQNVNYPAVQFYRRLGFRLCGFDERLYDRDSPEADEVALFFALDVTS
jgi:GNAT superfamily N-acetyltransferase